MTQEKKKDIAKALAALIDKKSGWSYTLRVINHTGITMVIRKMPQAFADQMREALEQSKAEPKHFNDIQNIDYHLKRIFTDGYDEHGESITRLVGHKYPEVATFIANIWAALNLNNYNNSDAYTDYFDVGHYAKLYFGEYSKPIIFE